MSRRRSHRKGRKRQRKKREHGTRRQNRIRWFRTTWAAMCWIRGHHHSHGPLAVIASGGVPLWRYVVDNMEPVQDGPFDVSSCSPGMWPVSGCAAGLFAASEKQ